MTTNNAGGEQQRKPRAKRLARREPVVTVHVTYVPRGEDLAFDARWDAMWAWLLAPLPDEMETQAGDMIEGEE